MQGLQRATEAARASRGLQPRIVHARSGSITLCGRGGARFKGPVADTPDEVTCKNCLKVQRSTESHLRTVALFQDGRWNLLRQEIRTERAAQDELAADHAELGHDDQAERCYGRAEALDRVLAVMDRMEAGE